MSMTLDIVGHSRPRERLIHALTMSEQMAASKMAPMASAITMNQKPVPVPPSMKILEINKVIVESVVSK
jgi:hypothetical protein